MSEHRLSWVAALAKLTTPHDAERAAAAMAAYMPFLVELPEQAFTLASMRHVAMQERRMMIPDLREVLEPLSAWWKNNRPACVALPPSTAKQDEPREELTPAQRRTMAEQISALADQMAPREPQKPQVRAHVIAPDVLATLREQARAKREAG